MRQASDLDTVRTFAARIPVVAVPAVDVLRVGQRKSQCPAPVFPREELGMADPPALGALPKLVLDVILSYDVGKSHCRPVSVSRCPFLLKKLASPPPGRSLPVAHDPVQGPDESDAPRYRKQQQQAENNRQKNLVTSLDSANDLHDADHDYKQVDDQKDYRFCFHIRPFFIFFVVNFANRLSARRPETSRTAFGRVELLDSFPLNLFAPRYDHLGYPLARSDLEGLVAQVDKYDADLASVVGVDRTR